MPADPNRVAALFAAVVAMPAQERAAYLDHSCGGDAELRRRVEALLQAHADAGSFLEAPALAEPVTTDAPAPSEGPGTRIAPYKLLQQIGEGGMGVVYMAEQQEPIRRMVALKIIKPGMDSAAVVARFEAERQALALMDHHNIARIFDGGVTDSGRPFFVMELVKGIAITRFCDENRLTPRQRLELFVPVCQAVQHAHQKGVIHRDLKPSNVLVTLYDGHPVPKVIDFGVAKALHQKLTERTMFTAFGTVVGTLEYMSPEQAEMNSLDVDTRGDVYSLGVLLYELLTGTTPLQRERLKKAAYTEILRLIREEEPPRPSTRISSSNEALARISAQRKMEPVQLAKLLRGELDWIVMKALEKERGRRYETALGLARDVEHYLHDEAVEACPPSVAYRLGKFARKYRGMLTTAVAIAALLVIAAGVSIWSALAARRAESIAHEQREQAAGERDRADKSAKDATANAAEARQALDRLSVEQGLRLAENDDLFTALLWFVKPLERGGLSPEEERIHRTRFACYLRHTHGRPVLRQMLFHEGMAHQLAFSPDATELLIATKESAQIWDLHTGRKFATLQRSKDVGRLRFLKANRVSEQLALTTRIWDATTGRQLDKRVLGSEPAVQALLSVLPQSPLQALGSAVVRNLPTNPVNPALSPDGRIVAQSEGYGFPLAARFELQTAQDGRSIVVQSDKRWSGPVCFSPDGCNVITTGKDRTDELWDVYAGRAAAPLFPNPDLEPNYEFSPDGRLLAIAHGDGIVRVWDLAGYENGAREGRADSPPRAIGGLSCSYHNWQGNGFFWFSFSERLSELREGVKMLPPSAIDPTVLAALRPDGQRLVTVAMDERKKRSGSLLGSSALLWDTTTGRSLGQAMEHPGSLTHVEFSADNRLLVTASNPGPVRLWDARTGEPSGAPLQHGPGVFYAGFSADGSRLVTCGADGTAQVWDTGTSKAIGPRLRHADDVNAVAFSPDGRRVATASSDGTARLWETATGRPVGRAMAHRSALMHVAFNSRGDLLLAQRLRMPPERYDDWRIWDAATQQEVSPNFYYWSGFSWSHLGATWNADEVFVPDIAGGQYGIKYDLRPDQRPAEDLAKISQLHAGQRLDDRGNLAPLAKAELQNLWNELRVKYPDEFTVRPEAGRAWRLERIKRLGGDGNDPKQAESPAIRLHREWMEKREAENP